MEKAEQEKVTLTKVQPFFTVSYLTADVNARTQFRIVFGLPQNLARDRRGVAFAEQNIANQISYRIAFAPPEIYVRNFSVSLRKCSSKAAIAFGTAGATVRKIL